MAKKKQAGAELKNNKRFFLGKNSDRNLVKRPQIDQLKKKKKKGNFGPKKKAGAEFMKKKKDFWAKNWEKI